MTRAHWLLKSEPDTYSIQDLKRDKKTNWNGIRNYQARNFLKTVRSGDLALIYHSGKDKAVVGIAQVVGEAYPDPEPDNPPQHPKQEWVQIDLKFDQELGRPVSLAEIKATASLKDLLLIRQSRLSVMPVTAQQFKALCTLGTSGPLGSLGASANRGTQSETDKTGKKNRGKS